MRRKNFSICHPSRAKIEATGGTTLSTKTNLPLELSSLLGRDTELSDLRHILGQQRLVTLSGPGGTGKTRIAKKRRGLFLNLLITVSGLSI